MWIRWIRIRIRIRIRNTVKTLSLSEDPYAVQVYICPWCDRVFRSETERIGHLLTGHGVEVREEEEGEGEEGGASTPHPFILSRSHTEEEQDQLGEYVPYVMRSACWNLSHSY